MNMTLWDWGIISVLLGLMIFAVLKIRKYNRSVADFLAANRCAGRYMLGVADGIAGLGAISIIALFEAYYASGFTFVWWGLLLIVVRNVTALSGWVQYRFRQTRALTMAEFLGMRYSRNLRIYAGILAFVSGVINFGIFPAVGARFFQHFCGFGTYTVDLPLLPPVDLIYAAIMIVLLSIALFFTFSGGQISVMVTDFIQGTFANIVLLIVVGFLIFQIPWSAVFETLSQRQPGDSMLDPFDTADTEIFNKWYFIVISFSTFWAFLAWQGNQAYSTSAINPHEARMGRILGSWREYTQTLLLVFLAVCAYVIYHNPQWSGYVPGINEQLDQIGSEAGEAIRKQTQVSVILSHFLTKGLVGAFCAVILAAFISTHDTYLHSWGSILIQDVILPFRKEKLSTHEHIRYLRRSILGVAIFIFIFSLLFAQYDAILMFQALTGIIFLGGGGTIIVFGLYWKRGTTAAAYVALTIGLAVFIVGFTLQKLWPIYHEGEVFPITSSWMLFSSIMTSIVGYVVVSLLGRDPQINTDKLFHKGIYEVLGKEKTIPEGLPPKPWQVLAGMGKDFNFRDRVIYCGITGWTFLWIVIFFAGMIVPGFYPLSEKFWSTFWQYYVWMGFAIGCFTTIWFLIGGIIDLQKLIVRLRNIVTDQSDDGE
jgi:solute:Na+ symporter, SSS family